MMLNHEFQKVGSDPEEEKTDTNTQKNDDQSSTSLPGIHTLNELVVNEEPPLTVELKYYKHQGCFNGVKSTSIKTVYAKVSDWDNFDCQIIQVKFVDSSTARWYNVKRSDLQWPDECYQTPNQTERRGTSTRSSKKRRKLMDSSCSYSNPLLLAPQKPRITSTRDPIMNDDYQKYNYPVRRTLDFSAFEDDSTKMQMKYDTNENRDNDQASLPLVLFKEDVYVIDLETSGTEPSLHDFIVEIGIVKINSSLHKCNKLRNKVSSVFHCFIDPYSYPFNQGTQSVLPHWRNAWIFRDDGGGMDVSQCVDSGMNAALVRDLLQGLLRGKQVTSYNRSFDVCKWLQMSEFWRIKDMKECECIMRAAKEHLRLDYSPKLNRVYEWVKNRMDQMDQRQNKPVQLVSAGEWTEHSAIGDALVAAQCLVFFRQQSCE